MSKLLSSETAAVLHRKSEKPTLNILQALRAAASLGVVLLHVNGSLFNSQRYWPDRPFGNIFEFGHAGVEFFFVLSGFIILTAHRRDLGRPERFASYLWKRFRRLYPIYWILVLIVAPVYFIVPSFGDLSKTSMTTVIDSILLVRIFPETGQIIDVSWTLFHEILFYGFFALIILNRRVGFALLYIWLAISLYTLLGSYSSPMFDFYFSPLHLLFAMGLLTAEALRRFQVWKPGTLFLGGIIIFAATATVDVRLGDQRLIGLSLCYGAASTLIIAGGVELERLGRIRVPGFLILLGNASYSIYLVHFLALSASAKLLLQVEKAGLPIPHIVIFALLCVTGVLVGLLFYLWVEKPLLALLGQRSSPGRGRAEPASVSSVSKV